MKKQIVFWGLIFLLVVSAVGCQKKEAPEKIESSSTTKEEPLIDVTLPASFFDEEGMAEVNERAKENGVKEVTVNDDGSVTYKMTENAHKKMLKEVKKSIDKTIKETLEDKTNYPSFADITYNDEVTEFEVSVDQASYGALESFGILPLYVSGGLYQWMAQVPEEQINTKVTIVNKDTKEIIETGDSASMAQEYVGE